MARDIIDATLNHSPYALADLMDVGAPDTKESPGVRLLERIQDAANEADADDLLESIREFVADGNDADDYSGNDLPDDLRDSIHEWADSAVQIYTFQCWQEFADLALWQEDLSELGEVSGEDLTRDVAVRAQYLVATRGLYALLAERAQALYAANPTDDLAHDEAEDAETHLDDATAAAEDETSDVLARHLEVEHGIDLTTVASGTDLDALHRSLDHADLA